MTDEHQVAAEPEIRVGDVHHLHEEVGSLVRHQLADRQQDRSAETLEVMEGRRTRLHPREVADVDDGRHDPHVVVAHLLQLARVVLGVGDRTHDLCAQAFDLAPPEIEQVHENGIVRGEVPARRHVVVHEHERFGACRQELVHRRLTDRPRGRSTSCGRAVFGTRSTAARRRAARARRGGRRSPTDPPGATGDAYPSARLVIASPGEAETSTWWIPTPPDPFITRYRVATTA